MADELAGQVIDRHKYKTDMLDGRFPADELAGQVIDRHSKGNYPYRTIGAPTNSPAK